MRLPAILSSLLLFSTAAYSCPDGQYESCFGSCCLPSLSMPDPSDVPDIFVTGIAGLVEEAAKVGDKTLEFSAENVGELLRNSDREFRKVVDDAIDNSDKAIRDSARTIIKSANDLVDASEAVKRFAERELDSYPDVLSAAEKRIREGKVADAIWHIGTDKIQHENKNTKQLMQESELVANAAQAAAGFYGGPAGAAAFAAWKTYNDSGGDLNLAIKAGAYAYALSAGYANTDALPAGTVGEIAKKAATTGAIAGAAVAASGGSTEDSLKAFLKSGGAVIVQSGQAYVEKNYVRPKPPDADIYCTTTLGGACSTAQSWYKESKAFATAVRDGPTVKTTGNGQWAVSWSSAAIRESGSEIPAVALTYIGKGSPYRRKMGELVTIVHPELRSTIPYTDDSFSPPSIRHRTIPDHFNKTPLSAKTSSDCTCKPEIGLPDNPDEWVYLGRYLDDGKWETPNSGDITGLSPEELIGSDITLNKSVNIRSSRFTASLSKLFNLGCFPIDSPRVRELLPRTTVHIVDVLPFELCQGNIWVMIEQE